MSTRYHSLQRGQLGLRHALLVAGLFAAPFLPQAESDSFSGAELIRPEAVESPAAKQASNQACSKGSQVRVMVAG